MNKLSSRISLLLFGLVILDLILSSLCLFFPATWFKLFHGTSYVVPQGLLRRTGGVWAAFTLFQLITLIKWRQQSYWLPVVGGIRLTEIFSDWVYLYLSTNITWFGHVALFISPLGNAFFGWILIKYYRQVTKAGA